MTKSLSDRLQEQQEPGWIDSRARGVKGIPLAAEWLRLVIYYQSATEERRDAARRFRASELSQAQRRAMLKTLFPKLSDVVERTWQGLARVPYDLGCGATFFRAPRHERAVATTRSLWFERLLSELKGHNPDVTWLAAWAGHMGYGDAESAAWVLAAAIDQGGAKGEEVLDILKRSATREHEIGVMGQHVMYSLLRCGREDAWEFIVKMLLAAQREEGLRQSILESMSTAHPGAFRRLLRVIADERLTRFASTVRAIDTWFGFVWDSMSVRHAHSIVERVITLLDDAQARAAAMRGKDAETTYLALWCEAYEDAEVALEKAAELTRSPSPEMRFVGVHALTMLELPEAMPHLTRAMADPDMRVAARAVDAARRIAGLMDESMKESREGMVGTSAAFDAALRLLQRISTKGEKFKPLVFPWGRTSITRGEVGSLAVSLCPPSQGHRLIEVLTDLDSMNRSFAAVYIADRVSDAYVGNTGKKSAKHPPLTPHARTALVGLLGDSSKLVRETACELLEVEKMTDEEAARHEELLSRSAGDIRTRAIARLMTGKDERVLETAERLLKGSGPKRQAGLDILRAMVEGGRAVEQARALAVEAGERGGKGGKRDKSEGVALAAIMSEKRQEDLNTSNAFGLVTSYVPRPLVKPRRLKELAMTRESVACLWSLNDLVEENKTFQLVVLEKDGNNARGEDNLLGALTWVFQCMPRRELSLDADRCRPNIWGLLDSWERGRSPKTRDADGYECHRAWVLLNHITDSHRRLERWPAYVDALSPAGRKGAPPHLMAIVMLLSWRMRVASTDARAWLLDGFEDVIARGDIARPNEDDEAWNRSRVYTPGFSALSLARGYFACPVSWGEVDTPTLVRWDALLRAADAGLGERLKSIRSMDRLDTDFYKEAIRAFTMRIDYVIMLWEAGIVSDDELTLRLVDCGATLLSDELGSLLRLRTRRGSWLTGLVTLTPRLDALVDRLRRRILEIEFERGDACSPATSHVSNLDPSGGIDAVIPALARLGKLKLARHQSWQDELSKSASFSQIIRHSRPGEADTPAEFAKAAAAENISEQRLVELALYQPRWAAHAEHALGWEGFEEGVLWLRTHTRVAKDPYNIEDEKEPWEAKAAECTPINPESLGDGAVDRAWFDRCYKKLGPKRWEMLYEAAKYASGGAGHTRARLFADAMLGRVTEAELTERVTKKRDQEAARAIGLVALKAGEKGRSQVLARFKVLQELRRTSSKHGGSGLQASEKRAVEIGMENLAWTAGYPDPLRLQWAMEIEELGDLARGPVSATVAGTTVTLTLDDDGSPLLTVEKGGKQLKSIPPALKKDKKVEPLASRVTALRRQGTRIRGSLEQAMIRGDEFEGGEVTELFSHPMLRNMLSRLVVVARSGAGGEFLGYPDKNGRALRTVSGGFEPLKATDRLRIAHPLDLFAAGNWHDWQSECFRAERVQPFKQVFREVYKPAAPESIGKVSNRYAGQQVQPRQALALFGSRGWVARAEEGVQRTFHREGITVRVEFEEGYFTPAEIDGLTLAGLSFYRSRSSEPLAANDVPARVFSEVMRDVDLVVSVAHRGGVDPEAGHGTLEMRETLLRETCELLSLANVRFDNRRAIIKGEHAEYALHLGSGTIHMLPGGTVWVVPVHSQHRGRIFLPFADHDPKTAEIISKALMLARDGEIKDPSILAQIRAR